MKTFLANLKSRVSGKPTVVYSETEKPPSYTEHLPVSRWKRVKENHVVFRQGVHRIIDEIISVMDEQVEQGVFSLKFVILAHDVLPWHVDKSGSQSGSRFYVVRNDGFYTNIVLDGLRTSVGRKIFREEMKARIGVPRRSIVVTHDFINLTDGGVVKYRNRRFTRFVVQVP